MRLTLITSKNDIATTGASAVAIGEKGGARLFATNLYQFSCTTDAWIRQGTSTLLTCIAKASFVDGETVTISYVGFSGAVFASATYEFDVAGNGVRAGNVQVNISADTTAITVAARLATAILATQTLLEVTNNGDGTLTIVAPDATVAYTETVANAGFTTADAIMTVSKADGGGTEVYAKTYVLLDGLNGPHVGVIQDSGTGTAQLTRCKAG